MKATLEVINRMQSDGVIGRYLDAVLERHGLQEKWAEFGAKFLR